MTVPRSPGVVTRATWPGKAPWAVPPGQAQPATVVTQNLIASGTGVACSSNDVVEQSPALVTRGVGTLSFGATSEAPEQIASFVTHSSFPSRGVGSTGSGQAPGWQPVPQPPRVLVQGGKRVVPASHIQKANRAPAYATMAGLLPQDSSQTFRTASYPLMASFNGDFSDPSLVVPLSDEESVTGFSESGSDSVFVQQGCQGPDTFKARSTSDDHTYGFTTFNFEDARNREADNQAQHDVFSWLRWAPCEGSPCFAALHKYFPGALPGEVVHARSRITLENERFGFTGRNTIFGTSVCPDEINSVNGTMVEIMRDHWGGMSFPLGGIGGAPFSGRTGFAAFSHHVPDNGNVFVVFGPHVSITENGEIGSVHRRGKEKMSTCCGAVIGAYNSCICQDIDDCEFDKNDMQMSWIRSQIAPHAERIKLSENPMAMLAHQAYEFVKGKVLAVVNNDFGNGYLALLGGIIINMPKNHSDHFLPLMFQTSRRFEDPQDLMCAFRSRVCGDVLKDDSEAEQRVHLVARMLGQVEMFSKAAHEDRLHAAASMVCLTFYHDECIVEQGDVGNTFFVLLTGEAVVEVNGNRVGGYLGTLPDASQSTISQLLEQSDIGKVSCFGERALMTDDTRAATIRVTSPRALVLSMSREIFEMVVKDPGDGRSGHPPRRKTLELEERQVLDAAQLGRRLSVLQAEDADAKMQATRAKENKQATHHYVFSWLNWSPQPDSACYRTLHDQFPCAIPGPALFCRFKSALEKFSFEPRNTIFGTSVCPDEINSRNGELVHQMKSHWGQNFPLGGISGAPFSGKTGFTAFSHHAPDHGNVIVLFGPHVGISADGEVGRFLREGQHRLSTACGAVVGAYHACIQDDRIDSFFDEEFDRTDMQMDWIKQQIAPHARRIRNQENPMAALAHRAYIVVEEEVEKVVSNDFGDGYLALIGLIQINMPKPFFDHFMPVKFEVRNKRESFDLMSWLAVH